MIRKILYILVCSIFIIACQKDNIDTSSGVKLRFSTDTVMFDTVFTNVASITKRLKVFNPSDDRIKISDIRIAGGNDSFYRINVDGVNARQLNDVEILGKDSIYVFVEVTVDPNDDNNPLVVNDSILFRTNGNRQNVKLVAWGQDTYVHTPQGDSFIPILDETGTPVDSFFFYSVASNTTWDNIKPHLIYGTVIIHNNATLTINPGTNVHLHHNSNIIAMDGGSLQVLGSTGDPVTIGGDRLDDYYKDLPGQWGRIWLTQDSKNNRFENAIVKNGTTGIYLGSSLDVASIDPNISPELRMINTRVTNMIRHGLLFQSSKAVLENCEISDCGENNIWMYIGGQYKFTQCTMANYFGSRQTPMLRMSNFVDIKENGLTVGTITKDLSATFENSIIYGSNENEMIHEIKEDVAFNYLFDNCLLKLDATEFDLDDATHFKNITLNENPKFKMPYQSLESDYQLDTLSVAKDIADPTIANTLPTDFFGNSRFADPGPDLGAYERIEAQ